MATRIAQVGGRGFGRVHLERIDRLAGQGRCELVALADPAGPLPDREVSWYPGLDELLAHHEVDVVSIATPINTHTALASAAMRAGADVLLEKPPVPSLADYWELLRVCVETGRTVQIGFQSLGSHGITRMRELAAGAVIGELRRVEVYGAWSRDRAYYRRSGWAGLRVQDGLRVADGVVTNPLAHAVATACAITGVTSVDDVAEIETELYHAHAIAADDTSWVQVRPQRGVGINVAMTLCAWPDEPPTVTLVGEHGRACFYYTEDRLDLTGADGQTSHEEFDRDCLLENLLDHRDQGTELLVPLLSTGAFMAVLEATQDRPDPSPIDQDHVLWQGEGLAARPVVDDICPTLRRCLESGLGFAAAGVPWADAAASRVWRPRTLLRQLSIDGQVVAEYNTGDDIMASSSPRPYLHPIRTLAGVQVSDTHPLDHDWHCGLSLTMQDVNGVNFWGGRTYVRDQGYQWLDDQGAIDHVEWLSEGDDSFRETLRWHGPVVSGAGASEQATPEPLAAEPVQVDETRAMAWRAVDERTWRLDTEVELAAVTPDEITLGGPGTNGRTDAGYGGFQLRIAPCAGARVWSSVGEGAEAVFGRPAEWVAYSADFAEGRATVVMADLSGDGQDDWFVRVDGWTGLGTALAWRDPVPLPLNRRYTMLVIDGEPSTEQVETALRA